MVKLYFEEHIFRYCLFCGKKLNFDKSVWSIAHGNWQLDEGGAYFAMGDQPTFYICDKCLKPKLKTSIYLKCIANTMLNYAAILRYNKTYHGNSIQFYIHRFKIYQKEYFELNKVDSMIKWTKENWAAKKRWKHL